MHIVFNKKLNTKKYQKTIHQVFHTAIQKLKPKYKKLEVSVAFVGKKAIKELNLMFRNNNQVTDVLSFPFLKKTNGQKDITENAKASDCNPATNNLILGDVYICLKIAKKQAKEYGHSTEREIAYLALHGLLHLFGYDHTNAEDKEVMRSIEEEVLSTLHLTRNKKVKKVMMAIGSN